jgi:16S rRNA (cytosine967-C5)-methyltransferase
LAAARILIRWQEGRGSAESLVREFDARDAEQKKPLEYVQRRRLRELVFGCVRLRGRYDHVLLRLTRKAPAHAVRAVLWIGLHEICELSTPAHAAVSSSVELARALRLEHAAGFVNGVLRQVLRQGIQAFFPSVQDDPLGYAASWSSHPDWLVQRWGRRLGAEQTLALCEADNRRPALVLRAPSGRREELLRAIQELEWEAEPGRYSPDAVVLRTRVPVPLILGQLPLAVAVQDEAAQVVPELLLSESPRRVLDLCAAPGGKALQLAARLGPGRQVFAADLSRDRMRRLLESASRLGADGVFPLVADGRCAPFSPGSFDAVLVDAPCTGTGVLARRHEARWRRRPEDLVELPVLQRALLHSAVDLCALGGIIVYATCSLEPEENDEVVDRVLAEREDLRELGAQGRVEPELLDRQRVQLWPHRHGCDGAYAAVLQRTEMAS